MVFRCGYFGMEPYSDEEVQANVTLNLVTAPRVITQCRTSLAKRQGYACCIASHPLFTFFFT